MKNKSKILLLPASLLLLTGCGSNANTSIPRGYTPVDKADVSARQAFFDKVSEDIVTTYEKGKDGFSAEGSLGIKEFYYNDGKGIINLTDIKADYSFGLVGLNEGTKKTKAVLKIENFGFKLNYKKNDKEYTLKASDLDAAAYYTDGIFYYDLSDKDIKTFVNDLVDFGYSMEGNSDQADAIAKDKATAAKYLGKYYLKDNDTVEDVADEIPTSLSDSQKLKIRTTVSGAFETLLAQDKVKDLLNLSEDKNSKGAAISLALTSEPVDIEDAKVSGDLAATVVFDKEGLFSRFGFAGSVNAKDATDSSSKEEIRLTKLDFGANFKYGANSVKLPSFSDYQEFPKN